MEGCSQTNIPILNTQEDPCIQGSLTTNCIFYGLAIDYLGTQNTASLAVILDYIVRYLVAANLDIVTLEEENREQELLIEELQLTIAQSLVVLENIQLQVESCCPTTTTTTSTTTAAPTTTTTTQYPGTYYNAGYTSDGMSAVCNNMGAFSLPLIVDPNACTNGGITLAYGTYADFGINNGATIYVNLNNGNVIQLNVFGSSQMSFGCSACQTSTTTSGPPEPIEVYMYQSNSLDNNLDNFSSLTNVTTVYLPSGQTFGQTGSHIYLDEELTREVNFPGNSRMWVQPVGSDEVYDYYSTFIGNAPYDHFNSNVRSIALLYSNSGANGVAYRSTENTVYGNNFRILYYNVNDGYQIGTQMYYDYALSNPMNENNPAYIATGIYAVPLSSAMENQNMYYIAPGTGVITSVVGILNDYVWSHLVGASPKTSNTGYCDQFYGNGVLVPPGYSNSQVSIGQTVYQNYNQNTGQYDPLSSYWPYFEYDNQLYTVLNGVIQGYYTCTTTTTTI